MTVLLVYGDECVSEKREKKKVDYHTAIMDRLFQAFTAISGCFASKESCTGT